MVSFLNWAINKFEQTRFESVSSKNNNPKIIKNNIQIKDEFFLCYKFSNFQSNSIVCLRQIFK